MKEIWKQIPNYPNYEVSNIGNVRNRKYSRTLKPYLHNTGYLSVSLCKNNKANTFYIHRLVAQAFIRESKDREVVNHKNFIKSDNRLENLEYATQKENIMYNYTHKDLHKISKEIKRAVESVLIKYIQTTYV